MSRIKGEEIRDFVWSVCEVLADFDMIEMEPGEDYDEDALRDRFSIALLSNPSLCNLAQIKPAAVINFINETIAAFGHIPCGSVKYIESLLSNPSIMPMVFPREMVMKT